MLLLKCLYFWLTDCHRILEERQRGLSGGPEHRLVSFVEGNCSPLLSATGPLTSYGQKNPSKDSAISS